MQIDHDTGEIITPFLRSTHNYNRDEVSRETALYCDPAEGKTQQQFKDEVDINTIVERFGLTGHLPENPRMPMSGDFTGVSDFRTALQMVREAEEAFMEFPAHVRAEFNNDPQRLMDFLGNDKNREKALEMGLIAKPLEKTRDMITAIDELSAKLTPANPAAKEK